MEEEWLSAIFNGMYKQGNGMYKQGNGMYKQGNGMYKQGNLLSLVSYNFNYQAFSLVRDYETR